MILFIFIAAIILFISIDEPDGLLCDLKAASYSDHPVLEVVKSIWGCFWLNVGMNALNIMFAWVVSFIVFMGCLFVCPSETSQWEFNINAMQDNMVTEGHWYGRRGNVDGELSYFYSRTMTNGEIIEHIPADKTYIRYSDTESPHVEVHQSRVDIPEWLTKVFFLEGFNTTNTSYYVLVVPDGTITNAGQYVIDME